MYVGKYQDNISKWVTNPPPFKYSFTQPYYFVDPYMALICMDIKNVLRKALCN